MDAHRYRAVGERGYTLVEIAIVVALIGVMAVTAVPSIRQWQTTRAGGDAARSISEAFSLARGRAIRSGHNQIVFLSSGAGIDTPPAGRDTSGATLVDSNGDPVPILILDDGTPGSIDQNCEIDDDEPYMTFEANDEVSWGVTVAGSGATKDKAPEDRPLQASAEIPDNGVTFLSPTGGDVTWVMFRPDGIPVAMSASCDMGRTGSGGGTVYVTNGERDYAVTLSPLGTTRIHRFLGNAEWTE